jgi:class 3 adenylate cyclase
MKELAPLPGSWFHLPWSLSWLNIADIVGYSRLTGADEDRILARLRTLRSDLIDPILAVHHGRVVKRTGDGATIEFRSLVDAVRCAIEVQSGLAERNTGLPPGWRASRAPARFVYPRTPIVR